MKSMLKAIEDYRGDSQNNEWETFWDYKIEKLNREEDILEDRNINETALLLSGYLCLTGMHRGLPGELVDVEELLISIRGHIKKISKVKFSNLGKKDRSTVMECYNKIEKELGIHGMNTTPTMITKILMALWGETPAIDSHFRTAYTIFYNVDVPDRNEFSARDYFEILLKIKKGYNSSWRKEIERLQDMYKKTEKGNLIPHTRLIDMGFWEIGK